MISIFKKGFSGLEVIILLAVLMLILSVALPSFGDFRRAQVLKSATLDAVSVLERARSYSMSSVDFSEHGVHFEANQMVIFKGTTYSSSDPSNQIIQIFSPASITNINLSGGGVDLYFSKLTGEPNKTGTIILSNGSLSKTITISATGSISMN